MHSTRANVPAPLVLGPPPRNTGNDDARLSPSSVSTRATGLSSATLPSTPPDTPRTATSAYSQGSAASGKSKTKAKGASSGKQKGSSLLGFLSVKEPSLQALAEYEQAQRREQALAAREKGRRVNAGLSSVSRTKMPSSVPKVNSKWDGLPTAMSDERKAKGSALDDSSSMRSGGSSRSGGPWSPGHPLDSSRESLDDFSLELSRGYNQPARPRSTLGGGASTKTAASASSSSSLVDARSIRSRPVSVDSQPQPQPHPPLPPWPLPQHVRDGLAGQAHDRSTASRPRTPRSCPPSQAADALNSDSARPSSSGQPLVRPLPSARTVSSSSSRPLVVDRAPAPAPAPTALARELTQDPSTRTRPHVERMASMPSLVPTRQPLRRSPYTNVVEIRRITAVAPPSPSPLALSETAPPPPPPPPLPPPPRSILVSHLPRSQLDGATRSSTSPGWKTFLRRIKPFNSTK